METINFKTSIDISPAGGGCAMRLGDIDGDGRMELVMVKPAPVSDERYFSHKVAAITAISADEDILWQTGDTEDSAPYTGFDVPVQIYDIDRDGKNEVIAVFKNTLAILDGRTAEIKKEVPLPSETIGGSVTVADLEGSGYAQNIILKNKFSHIWAFDSNLNILWDFEGNVGHAPVAYDINGDGREEIIAGYNILSASGELLWKADMADHAHSVCVECLYHPDEPIVIICGPTIHAYSSEGTLLWELPERAGNIVIGKFRDGIEEPDILILDNLSLFDSRGRFLYQKNETIYLPTPVYGFDDSGKTYIAGHKKEDICTTLYDGYMRAVYALPTFGNIACGDIPGNSGTQILIYNDETADVYSSCETDLSVAARPYPRRQTKQFYNVSLHNTLPLSQITQGYVADDFASQNILKWADTYSALNRHNSYAKVSRLEFVLLLATLLNIKEEFSENFSDVPKDSSFYEAVGTFKKLGIVSGDDNLFLPEQPITVSYANDILEKLSIPVSFNFNESYEISKQDMARLIQNISSAQ